MKKFLALVLALIMVVSLCACGKKTEAPEAPAEPQPSEAPAEPQPTTEQEIVMVGGDANANSSNEKTFEGILNIYNGSSITVSNQEQGTSAVFEIVEGTILPAQLNPGCTVKVVYSEGQTGNNAVEITMLSSAAAAETIQEANAAGGVLLGYVSEAEQDHISMTVDGRVYRFTVSGQIKTNASIIDVGDYISMSYTGVITDAPRATEVYKYSSGSGSNNNQNGPYIIVTPRPAPTADPFKPAPNPMKNGSGTVVSVGGNTVVVRMGGNDCWFTVRAGAGSIPSPDSRISFEYNSYTGEITQIY